MSTVAELLRQAREAQHLTLSQVAETTKIRTDHLRALEAGDYNVFMAPVYIKGFVRSYASLLKLDLPAVMALLEAELKQTGKFAEPPPLTRKPEGLLDLLTLQLSKVNWGLVAPLLAVALVITLSVYGYRAWRRHKSRDPLANLGPGLYQPKPALTELYLAVPTNAPRR